MAQQLAHAPVRVTVVDRNNYHLFVPLLYQVATAALSPADIAEPIRHVLGRYANIRVMLGEVMQVDTNARHVALATGETLQYDRLVVATGSTSSYFGHDEWRRHAPPASRSRRRGPSAHACWAHSRKRSATGLRTVRR